MQDLEQIHERGQVSGIDGASAIGQMQTLCITVIRDDDPCIGSCRRYRFELSPATVVFETRLPDARGLLVCELVNPDGSPFQGDLNFVGCRPQGTFFKKHPPRWGVECNHKLLIQFDFSEGNASGMLELELSNNQSIRDIRIFNVSPVLERANDYATLTITQAKDGSYSHQPSSGIVFNNASKDTPSILFCILIGPDGRPTRDAFFTGYTYKPIDDSTARSSCMPCRGTNVFAIWFDFQGVASGGALTLDIGGPQASAGSIPIDPQVVNVPTTGGSPGQ